MKPHLKTYENLSTLSGPKPVVFLLKKIVSMLLCPTTISKESSPQTTSDPRIDVYLVTPKKWTN